MKGKTYGYARVSTKDQNLDRQLCALREFGIPEKQIFREKLSGRDFDRPVYQKLLKKLKPGDTLVIKSIDRLGRNYEEIIEQWRIITKEKQVTIVVLDIPLLSNVREGKDLTHMLISDIVLQLMSYMAQMEREFIHQRQAEGIAAARAKGVRFGRKPKEKPYDFPLVFDQWKMGKLSARKAAKKLQVSRGTFMKWTRETGNR